MFKLFFLLFFLFLSCEELAEQSRVIKLKGRINAAKNEISSLTWYKERLILLTQLPSTGPFGEKRLKKIDPSRKAIVYSIAKSDILDFLDGKIEEIQPQEHRIFLNDSINPEFENGNNYQGFEAIVFKADTAFLSIESEYGGFLTKALVKGNAHDFELQLLKDYKKIPNQSKIKNMAEESILLYEGNILLFHEANSKMANKNPLVHHLNSSLDFLKPFALEHQEWRLTDATALDRKNRFWMTNYMYPKDSEKIGEQKRVEQLIEFKIDKEKIRKTGRRVQIPQISKSSVNWEGIVRLDNRGFLIINDEYPRELGTRLLFLKQSLIY